MTEFIRTLADPLPTDEYLILAAIVAVCATIGLVALVVVGVMA